MIAAALLVLEWTAAALFASLVMAGLTVDGRWLVPAAIVLAIGLFARDIGRMRERRLSSERVLRAALGGKAVRS